MWLSFDRLHNIAYLRLAEALTEVETLKVSEDLYVDLAPDGSVYGLEFLNANEQIGRTVELTSRTAAKPSSCGSPSP
jgi:uncharacterized protein YuzE